MPYNCMWAWLQDAASNGIELLRALIDALSDCSAAVGSAVQQQQRLAGNKQQPGELVTKASELHERSMWLPAAAGSLMLLMGEHMLYGRVGSTQQLLDILGQLLQEVLWLRLPRQLQMHVLLSVMHEPCLFNFAYAQDAIMCGCMW